jgi:hypothetical protein
MGISVFTITITSLEVIPEYEGPNQAALRINFDYTPLNFTTFIKNEITITIKGINFMIGIDPGANTTGLDNDLTASGGSTQLDILQPLKTDTSVSANARRAAIFNNFIQGGNITVSLTYSNAAENASPVSSASVTYYNVIGIDANNILLRDHLKIFTLVDLSTDNKSVILPHTTVCKGIILHFKVTAVDNDGLNTFTISPYMDQYPDGPPATSFSTTQVEYTGDIDGTNGPIYFNTLNSVISIISDGWNWTVLNKYSGAASFSQTGILPEDRKSEISEKNVVRYTYLGPETGTYINLLLYPMTQSYLKYIFLKNNDSNQVSFTLYFPSGTSVDNQNGVSETYNTTSFTLNSGKVAAVVLTFINNRYYIISAQVIPDYSQATGFANPTVTVTRTVNFVDTATRIYMPPVTTYNSSICRVVIIKVKTVTNIIAVAQDSGVFIMNDSYTAISMASSSVLWFIINVQNDTPAYLPICYYLPS